jgi:hypothetical protein
MNQDEEEDSFLYGDNVSQVRAAASGAGQGQTVDHDMERASEEGEVGEEDDDDEDDSVDPCTDHSNNRTLNSLLKRNLGSVLLHRRISLLHVILIIALRSRLHHG